MKKMLLVVAFAAMAAPASAEIPRLPYLPPSNVSGLSSEFAYQRELDDYDFQYRQMDELRQNMNKELEELRYRQW